MSVGLLESTLDRICCRIYGDQHEWYNLSARKWVVCITKLMVLLNLQYLAQPLHKWILMDIVVDF